MPPRILYVAGYSRSGSTLLDMMLDTSPRIASTGELAYLGADAATAGRLCTCGAAYGDCARYGGWLATRPPGEAARLRAVERRGDLKRLLAEHVPDTAKAEYRAYGRSLFSHVAGATGADLIVDSSKSARDAAGRPLALSHLAGLDVRVLHLTRDPRHTVMSYVTQGSNWAREGHRAPGPLDTWRPVVGWVLANRIARHIGRVLGPERYMHLRFEDLLADPADALSRIGGFIGIDLGDVADRVRAGSAFTAGHMVGGNRARLTPQVLRPGTPPPARLPQAHALCLGLVGRPLAREFGYA